MSMFKQPSVRSDTNCAMPLFCISVEEGYIFFGGGGATFHFPDRCRWKEVMGIGTGLIGCKDWLQAVMVTVWNPAVPSLHYIYYILMYQGWDSSVSIVTRYGLDGPGIESRWGARFSAPGPGAHPTSYTVGTGSFQG